jgi:hypothetical protein
LITRAYDVNKSEINEIFKDNLKITFW